MLSSMGGQVNESRGVVAATKRLLLKHRLSNNVGVVNQYWDTLQPALDEERYFALVEDVPIQPRLARNQGSGLDSVRPMHLFDPHRDHDY